MIRRFAIILVALLLTGSLLFRSGLPVFAEEDPSGTEETISGTVEHSSFSAQMMAAAMERYNNVSPGSASSRKIVDDASMPYIGKAYVVALHVDFPDRPFAEGDTEEALQSALGIDLNGNVYPSLYDDQYANINGYYQRASYGKLAISGDTFSYHAQKTKADYTDSTELITEAMNALDSEVDFSRYDADLDGRIDTIYLHVPFDPADDWGTTWWPNCSSLLPKGLYYDNVQAASRVVISRELNTEDGEGIRTLIHETGHAMGFPDYYSYDKTPSSAGGKNELSGILTFDMMDSNNGDHNGFSKWIAGWLEESDVTRVVANKEGVRATRGGVPVGTTGEDGSVTLDLSSFDSEILDETGGIIIVGNDEKAPFSRYFLIQYDTYAGNQKVCYTHAGEDVALPSGFRVFRVQADLNEVGTLRHNNTTDPLYDKLIELVDPDYKDSHTLNTTPRIPCGFGKDSYYCSFYGGSSLTPVTAPSTNYYDNLDIGFTGISIDFLESGSESGKLKISYSEEYKPVVKPLEVSLIEGTALPGGYTVTLKGNRSLVLSSLFGPSGISSSVKNGEDFLVSDTMKNYSLDGDTLKTTFYIDTDMLRKDKSVVVRCRTGAFETETGDWSPPFTFEVPISQDIADLSESGYIEDIVAKDKGHVLSLIQRAEDGSFFFYGYVGQFLPLETTEIYRYTFTEDDPTKVTKELLDFGSEERADAREYINTIYYVDKTEGASIVPKNADLGEFPVVLDAVKLGDFYYTVSFREPDYMTNRPNKMAVSMLDADGNLLKQIFPAGDEIPQTPEASSRVRIQVGPNEKLAVLLFRPFQERSSRRLTGQMATFFYDRDLNSAGRLSNYSTGCGTWLKDGRFIAFGQRTNPNVAGMEDDFPRGDLICYDITTVIDPAPTPTPDPPTPTPPTPAPDPSGDHGSNTPATGDENKPILWIGLMTAALGLAAVLITVYVRKRKE